MIKIKALNDDDHSDSSDSEYQVTREAEEESLNKLYLNALKAASNGDTEGAINLLQELKRELESEIPKVKEVLLLKKLKYVTYKNLGLLKDDLDLILDALDIDDSDLNLWITAGKKCKDRLNFILAKYCFESAYRFTPSNYIVINNLIEVYFVLNDIYNCVKMCLCALDIDPDFLKAIIIINECVRLLPPLVKELSEFVHYISVDFGGDFVEEENEEYMQYKSVIINQLTDLKTKRFKDCNSQSQNSKRKKLYLLIDRAKIFSIDQIGEKVIALNDLIQSETYNICTPIDLDIQNKDNFKNDILSEKEATNLESVNCSSFNENLKTCSAKSTFSLSDFDKRRSTRVKSIRNAKNREFDDDQSIFDTLMDLLPTNLKNNEGSRLDSLDRENNSSNSASMPLTDNKTDSKSVNEVQIINTFLTNLEEFFSANSSVNIFELFEFFLSQVCSIKSFTIPSAYMNIYHLYRQQYELPSALMCEIDKDISLKIVWVCLTANEIKYNKNECLFLTQILNQLSEKLNTDEYRQFVIRLLVLRGTKELNNDYLSYALDLCSDTPEFHSLFKMDIPISSNLESKQAPETSEKSFKVFASNNLIINEQYINTILQMQNVSISKLSIDKNTNQTLNYTQIIQLFFTKSDLTLEERHELCDAIVNTQMWEKGIEFFDNCIELTEKCLTTIYQCIKSGKRVHLSPKLTLRILKYASEGKSSLPWSILYWSFIGEGLDIKEPGNPLIKFCKMGHSFLGRKGLCTAFDGEFLLSAVKVFIENDIEEEALKCFTCLYNFPPRKNNNLSNHLSPHVELKWSHCKDIYDYFATDDLPEFDSRNGITQETKELFLKILRLIPEDQQPRKQCQIIVNYLNKSGNLLELQQSSDSNPDSITSTIYYLLADFHFKSKDFLKAKQFYLFDLALNINRFDSWAGLALATNYQLDQLLIEGCSTISEKFQRTALSAIQSFEQALRIQPSNSKLWIEFGLLSYNMSSILSRIKKRLQLSAPSKELPKGLLDYDEMLNNAKNCFEKANSIESDNDELWLSYYMLGKVSEKKSENLLTTLEFYEWADLCLFLDGAVYPKKISYYNPPNLAIEALEIHYRIHTSIMKYLVNNRKFSARMLRQLKLHLIRATRSPFVTRKTFSSFSTSHISKKANISKNISNDVQNSNSADAQISELLQDVVSIVAERDIKFDVNKVRNALIQMCIRGIKRCLSRYLAHYKSHYSLAYFYFHTLDFQTAKSILLGDSSNKYNELLHFENEDGKANAQISAICGLFVERKPQNFFNGIWRIPVDEIERSGNFNAHMFRCTLLLIRICILAEDPFTLQQLAIQLHKSPEQDKRYLNEPERIYLSLLSFEQCFLLLQNSLNKPEVNKNRLIDDTQTIAQNFVKNNVFTQETINFCRTIKNKLEGRPV